MVCESSRGFFVGKEDIHLSGRVKITPEEYMLRARVTRPNSECCQNLVSNTVQRFTACRFRDVCLILAPEYLILDFCVFERNIRE